MHYNYVIIYPQAALAGKNQVASIPAASSMLPQYDSSDDASDELSEMMSVQNNERLESGSQSVLVYIM